MSRWADVPRSDWVWWALPYVFAALGAVITFAAGVPAGVGPRALALTIAVVLWHTWWVVLHPQWLERALLPMLVYYAGLAAGTAALLSISVTFLPLYLVCLPMAFVALPGRWAYAGVGVALLVGLVAPTLPELLIPGPETAVSMLGGGALAAVAGGAIRAAENQARARQRALSELEAAMAENLALQARLLQDERAVAARGERDRIAAEIHDTLAADLAGVVAQLEALAAEQPGEPAPRVVRATAAAREALRAARESVTTLRAAAVADPLSDRLRQALEDGDQTLPEISVHTAGAESLTIAAPVAEALLRGAQEAVRNSVRHARAARIRVTLSDLGADVAVDVVDDGVGFDQRLRPTGHGLAITAERLAAVDGSVIVTSTLGEGTAVTLTAPRSLP